MHILLTTSGLMFIFALFCAAQWHAAVNMAFMDAAATENFVTVRKELTELISENSKAYYEENLPKEPKDKSKEEAAVEEEEEEEYIPIRPDSLDEEADETFKKGKRTSYLHVALLFKDENPSTVDGKGKDCFILLKNLLRELYQGQPFFENAKKKIPDLEERFIRNLLEKAENLRQEELYLTASKQLCNLDLEDELQSYVRYKMFTGTKSRFKKISYESLNGYYPLTEVISLRKHEKLMSIWLAPRPLLMALFEDEKVVEDVLAARREIYNDLRKDKNKSAVQTKESEMRRRFSQYIHTVNVDNIDFGVSRQYAKP